MIVIRSDNDFKFAYHDQIVAIDQKMCNFQTIISRRCHAAPWLYWISQELV